VLQCINQSLPSFREESRTAAHTDCDGDWNVSKQNACRRISEISQTRKTTEERRKHGNHPNITKTS
jgi:hypothetical protein